MFRGNAADGIHGVNGGCMAVVLVRRFPRRKMDQWRIPPTHSWTRLKFKIHWRGDWHEFDLPQDPAQIRGVIFDSDGVFDRIRQNYTIKLGRNGNEEGLPFDQQANDAIRVCRVGSR